MKIFAVRGTYFLSVLMILTTLTVHGASGSSKARTDNRSQEHLSGLMASVHFADGSSQIVRINGIGCTESLCSTVLMKAKTETNRVVEIWFDSIAAIRDIRQNEAVFVGKDSSQRRLTFVPDFRVLYVSNTDGAIKKIDLANIKSLEMFGIGQ
jgi:hypothetical protein